MPIIGFQQLIQTVRARVLAALGTLIEGWKGLGDSDEEILDKVYAFLASSGYAEALSKKLVALHEHKAYQLGRNLANRALGASEKEWVTVGDSGVCDLCTGNAAVGSIPIAAFFPSGDQVSPAHHRCRCNIAYSGVSRKSLYWSTRA